MIQTTSIVVRREGRTLLNDISLCLRPGEIMVLMGPNGAGKSTLLKVLGGELRPSSGTVRFGDQRLEDWRSGEIAKLRAVLPQESRVGFALTALEVVLLGRYPHNGGWNSQEDLVLARAALARTDAGHLAERSYPTLSGGERARVQLARCLCQIWEPQAGHTRCLLLDEPTASLDPAHQHLAMTAVRRFAREEQAAVCVVLHDFNLAAQYADRIAILHGGCLVACGQPPEIFSGDHIDRVFGVETLFVSHPRVAYPVIVTAAGRDQIRNGEW